MESEISEICLSASFIFIRKRAEFPFELLPLFSLITFLPDFPLLSVPGGAQLICLFDTTGLKICVLLFVSLLLWCLLKNHKGGRQKKRFIKLQRTEEMGEGGEMEHRIEIPARCVGAVPFFVMTAPSICCLLLLLLTALISFFHHQPSPFTY